MKYLVLSDVHANLEALEAVLTDSGPFDGVLFLGDLVGYGPNPNECVEIVRELPELTALAGNHDWAALRRLDLASFNSDARKAATWTAETLTDDAREWLAALSPKLETSQYALAHGSPRDPIWEYMVVDFQGPPNFAEFEAPFCFVGHTHVPRIFAELQNGHELDIDVQLPEAGEQVDLADGTRRIVNPGGVGQPRNGDPRAAYGIWDTETGQFTFKRVPYDVEATQKKIEQAGLPPVLGARLRLGL